MRFAADHYFHIGHAHYTSGKPCQDYATSMAGDGWACAIVSDGCSTAGETDIGSRIVVAATRAALANQAPVPLLSIHERIRGEQRHLIRSARVLLGFGPRDMYATCLYAFATPAGVVVHLQGDGVVAMRYRDGMVIARRYEWIGNMPFYPAYESQDLTTFVREHGDDLTAMRLTATEIIHRDGKTETNSEQSFSLGTGISGIQEPLEPMLSDLEYVAVFTDGVTQIEGVPWEDAVVAFLAFKTSTGEFAKRRMARHIERLLEKGHKALDDISCAVIRIERAEEVGA